MPQKEAGSSSGEEHTGSCWGVDAAGYKLLCWEDTDKSNVSTNSEIPI